MVRLKLPDHERRDYPVYVLLRGDERRAVEEIARKRRKSKGAVIREAFLRQYRQQIATIAAAVPSGWTPPKK